MTRRIGLTLIALAAVGVTLASATESQAWGRRHRGNGSCGSWGGNGSNGGSFGGLFSRWRNGSHGGWGSNGGRGSHGGWGHHNGCGSHGGWGSNGGHGSHGGSHGGQGHVEYGTPSEARPADRPEGDVRYYGERLDSTSPTPAPAPIMEDPNRAGTDQETVEPPSVPAPEGDLQNRNQPPGTNQPNQIQNDAGATGSNT
jgi:hypothetical protein